MRKNSVLAVITAAAALLCSCGSGDNGSQAETTAATTTAAAETTTAETEEPAETETPAESEAAPQGNDYDYPESIMSENAPYARYVSTGGALKAVIPGIYDDTLARGGYADYLKFERNDNKYFMYIEGAAWTTEVPEWMDAETMSYTLDDVPSFMFSSFVDLLDGGPFNVNHSSPFGMKTEITLESDEHIEIDGTEFIRQSGTAHGEKYGKPGDAYFTVYYGISDHSFSTIEGNKVYNPFMVIAFSGDLSDEGRQIVKDSADYAMTHSTLPEAAQ